MTQEEAIKILRDVHDKALFSVRNALETIIPELSESEDERIRKQILDCFGTMRRQGCFPSKHKEQYDSWISWLEKQKEKRPARWSEEDEKMRENLLYLMLENNSQDSWEGTYEWLKSLHPSWKPSKKQMDALWTAKSYYGRAWACDTQRSLESLYDDLEEQCK